LIRHRVRSAEDLLRVIEHRIGATHDLSGVTYEGVWTACQRTHAPDDVFADQIVVVSEASVAPAKSSASSTAEAAAPGFR